MSPQDSTTAEGTCNHTGTNSPAINSRLWLPTGDRLARFGTELIEQMLEQNGGELLVLNQRDLSPPEELTQDLLAILTVFSARTNGLRRYRKKIQEDQSLPRPANPEGQLKLWFGAARFTYNHTIELLNSDGAPKASWLGVKKDILIQTTRLDQARSPMRSTQSEDACLAVSAVKKFNKQLNLPQTDKDKWHQKRSRTYAKGPLSAPGRIPARPSSYTPPR